MRENKVKTSIFIDPQLRRDIKMFAMQHDQKPADVIDSALRQYLETRKTIEAERTELDRELSKYSDPVLASVFIELGLDPEEMFKVPEPHT